MVYQNKRHPTRVESKALDLVEEWLRTDSGARPQRMRGVHKDTAYRMSRPLYDRQIHKRWESLQEHNNHLFGGEKADTTTSLHIGRMALEASSLAQHGFILGRIARGGNILAVMDESWHTLQNFKKHVRAGEVPLPPVENLSLSVQEAIQDYTNHRYGDILYTYLGMVAYSTTVAVQLRDDFADEFVLPQPGQPDGESWRWEYNSH